jgi:LAO/AO transport system kinase
MSLAEDILRGDRRALARAITLVENNAAGAIDALAALFSVSGQAHLIGITGAPGTGKSTLVNRLALALRGSGRTVAIVAVDPTSPFTGGALLGDRIRMRSLAGDPGIFIRSMATRGSLGGLARTTSDVVTLLDGAGFDAILIETVGAGQAEVDIARQAQTVIVVEAPGFGDDVQAIKAGILEIADILVVNKADDPRAQNTVRALRSMLDLGGADVNHTWQKRGHVFQEVWGQTPGDGSPGRGWEVPIEATNALSGEGVESLLAAVDRHRGYLQESDEWQQREYARVLYDLDAALQVALLNRFVGSVEKRWLAAVVERIMRRELLPQAAVELLLEHQDQ